MSAFHLYQSAAETGLRVTLAHGVRGQPVYPEVFASDHLVAPIFRMDEGEAVFEDRPQSYLFTRFICRGRRWLEENAGSYDVLHGLTGYGYTVSPALAAERAGLPAVVKIIAHHGDLEEKRWLDRFTGRIRRRRESLKRLSAVIAISHDIRDELIGYGIAEEKVVYVPNGVNVDRFKPVRDLGRKREVRERLGIEDRFTLLFAGSVVERKGPHVLVEALAMARRTGADAQLLIAGPGMNSRFAMRLMARVRTLELERHIRFLGMVEDMLPVFHAADLYTLASRAEGLSNAVLEAMASGLPVIAAPISGNRDLIDGDNGQLIAGGAGDFAAAIREYFEDSGLLSRHSRGARATVVERFSSSAVLAAHLDLFRRILSGGYPADASM